MDLLWGQGSRENRGKIPRSSSKDNKKARRSGLPIWRYLMVSGRLFELGKQTYVYINSANASFVRMAVSADPACLDVDEDIFEQPSTTLTSIGDRVEIAFNVFCKKRQFLQNLQKFIKMLLRELAKLKPMVPAAG